MSNRAAFVDSPKGPIVVRDTEVFEPEQGEVQIKVHACAIQPIDAKVARLGIMPLEYPAILGSQVAGVISAVGADVSTFSVGDRVVGTTKVVAQKKAKFGGLQRFAILDASGLVEIGDVDFVKSTTLAPTTAPAALFADSTLKLHRPTIPSTPLPASERNKKILIWGGSSSTGSLSIAYAKLAGYTVISTSSPRNFDLVKACGADYVFDHSDPATIDAIRDLFPIDYWFDTISLKPSLSSIFKILAPEGKSPTKANVLILLPPSMTGVTDVPEGITLQTHRFATRAPENAEWHKYFLARGGFLEQAIKKDLLKTVPADVLGGLEKVNDAFDLLMKGVSAKKIVVDPWN